MQKVLKLVGKFNAPCNVGGFNKFRYYTQPYNSSLTPQAEGYVIDEPVSGQARNPPDPRWFFLSFLQWRSFTVLGTKVAPFP